jgi:hypothetical protein
MVRATMVVLSALVRVMPVQASVVGHSTPMRVPIMIGTIALVFIVIIDFGGFLFFFFF